ncbi:MAG TPA: RdgB/HAM1 family non-canonical purine NTP pyrophosphatase [Rhodospirillales bacterium]|nr:RdgB/HAM1 family non-canonical purine NTP pyrophosphatase [Rhodospirillales bacterium]
MTPERAKASRHFSGNVVVVASHNPGKVEEIAALLSDFGVEARGAGELGLSEPAETGVSFAANAIIKALAAARASGQPALADDSGLEVLALSCRPGIHSARWAGRTRDFRAAMRRLRDALGETADRRARFVCALALCWPDGHHEVFEGAVQGHLVWPPRGTRGFGYDPIFVPRGRKRTFGEMAPDEKHRISHRADAFRRLVAACFADRQAPDDGPRP